METLVEKLSVQEVFPSEGVEQQEIAPEWLTSDFVQDALSKHFKCEDVKVKYLLINEIVFENKLLKRSIILS